MPRDLPIGNGNMLVAFDSAYQLRELYYPYVGQANHTMGHPFRFGVWVDGNIAWIDDPGWERSLRYETDTLVTEVRLRHEGLGLALTCRDCVDYDVSLYLRRLEVDNLRDAVRDVRLFFHHDFHIGGWSDGDTAYYHPVERALIHYKGRHWFLINALYGETPGLSSFATGIKRHHGAAGTWHDAHDGALGRNPIAQGSVDSTAAIHLNLDRRAVAHYWIGAGDDIEQVLGLNRLVCELGPEAMIRRVRAYWRQWVSHDTPHPVLPDDLKAAYRRSLLILRTQIDNRGAIIAANDSDSLDYSRDSYSYLWPRDGALVAHSLDLAGYHDVSDRYFALCPRLLTSDGFFMHKYNPDGSVGSSWHPWCGADGTLQLPIQEDETALTLHVLWEHYALCRDIDFVRTLYTSLIEPAGDFLCSYRDPVTRLPAPSWDLWEERRGIHLFTVASVWAGLMAASNFAEIFGDDERAARYREAAREIHSATVAFLFDRERGRFVRGLTLQHGQWTPDYTLDSSQSGLFLFGMLPSTDPRVVATMEAIETHLWCRTPVGGVARYECDPYYQMTHDTMQVPGNPWYLCTLWLAQWYIASASQTDELAYPLDLLEWTARHALPSGAMAEQLHPYTGSPLSVSPLTWSHATFVTTVCLWEAKHRRLTDRRRTTRPAARAVQSDAA